MLRATMSLQRLQNATAKLRFFFIPAKIIVLASWKNFMGDGKFMVSMVCHWSSSPIPQLRLSISDDAPLWGMAYEMSALQALTRKPMPRENPERKLR